MKIVVPMAGLGKRFNDEHSHTPKPLTLVDGVPMISRVINMFSQDDEYIFICNEKHLNETNMESVLRTSAPRSTIVPITDLTGGPIYGTANAFNLIDDLEDIIINYCDFLQVWDYNHFKDTIKKVSNDGAIISFKGFHPASLGETYYAYMKINEQGYLTYLREKQAFSENRMDDFASTGTYYFKRGKDFKEYSRKVIESGFTVNGEAYVTLPYMLMIKEGLNILNYEVPKFICLGTIRDYKIYNFWSSYFFHRTGKPVEFKNDIKTENQFPLFNTPDYKEFSYWQDYFDKREDHPYKK